MTNSNTSRDVFMGKCNSKTPVQLSGINYASGTSFSFSIQVVVLSYINFKYKPPSITKVEDLKNSTINKIII